MNAVVVVLFILFSSVLSPASVRSVPFIVITAVSPDYPEVFDVVTVTAHVEANVTVTEVWWSFGDRAVGSLAMNSSGVFEFCVSHIYQAPGFYYLRVGLRDRDNRTAEDVGQVEVQPRGTVLTLDVSPKILNTSLQKDFIIAASLASNIGVPLPNQRVFFWYSSDAMNWLPIMYASTGTDGRVSILFKPPFDGNYEFKASYDGDSLYGASEVYSYDSVVTPELPAFVVPLVFFAALAASSWLLRKKTLNAPVSPLIGDSRRQ